MVVFFGCITMAGRADVGGVANEGAVRHALVQVADGDAAADAGLGGASGVGSTPLRAAAGEVGPHHQLATLGRVLGQQVAEWARRVVGGGARRRKVTCAKFFGVTMQVLDITQSCMGHWDGGGGEAGAGSFEGTGESLRRQSTDEFLSGFEIVVSAVFARVSTGKAVELTGLCKRTWLENFHAAASACGDV